MQGHWGRISRPLHTHTECPTPSALLPILHWYSLKLWLFTQLLSEKFKIIQGSRSWEWVMFGPLPSIIPSILLAFPYLTAWISSLCHLLLFLLRSSSFDTHFETLATTILSGSDVFAHHKMHAPKANKPLSEGSFSLRLLYNFWALTHSSPTSAVKPEASSS